MASIIFILNKEHTKINCSNEDYIEAISKKFEREKNINIKDNKVFYLYRGKKINPKFRFNKQIKKEDLKKNEITILCIMKNMKQYIESKSKIDSENKIKLKSKEIFCPDCGEPCKIKIEKFKIKFYECQNGHEKDNINLEQFNEIQKVAKSKIKCNICNTIQETSNKIEFYKCLSRNINVCKLCKEFHHLDNLDNLVDYKKYFCMCNIHDQKYVSYCNKCEQNLCSKCENEHKNENDLIDFNKMAPKINDTEDEIFQIKIIQFNRDIDKIIEILKKIKNKIKLYYEIYHDNAYNFDIKNINYIIFNNINEISNYNEKLINKINGIVNEAIIEKKVINLIKLYHEMLANSDNILKY